MNGIEKIIGHIMAESEAECKAVAADADAECERIRARYAQVEQDEYWKIVNAGTKEAERRLDRLSSLAALEAKKQVLATQQEMLAGAFDLAVNKLIQLPVKEYTAFLARLACTASLTGSETIHLSSGDLNRIGAEVLNEANAALRASGKTAALTLSDKAVDIRGGLILSGGNIEVNCSVDALVEQEKNELSPSVTAMLFN